MMRGDDTGMVAMRGRGVVEESGEKIEEGEGGNPQNI